MIKKHVGFLLFAVLILAGFSACGEHVHEWKQQSEQAATCSAEGVKRWVCSACGEERSEVLPKTEHDFRNTVTQEPTCAAAGVLTKTCTVCGAVETEAIETVAHLYEERIIKEPTCSEEGEKEKICSVCGEKVTEPVPKNDQHDYKETVTRQATCKEEGTKLLTCSRCGESHSEPIPKTDQHDYKETVTRQATCRETGTKVLTCALCGASHTESIPKTAHSYKRISGTDAEGWSGGSATYSCQVCQSYGGEGFVLAFGSDDTMINNVAIPFSADCDGFMVERVRLGEINGKGAVSVTFTVTATADLNGCFIGYLLSAMSGATLAQNSHFTIYSSAIKAGETKTFSCSVPLPASVLTSPALEYRLSFYSPF